MTNSFVSIYITINNKICYFFTLGNANNRIKILEANSGVRATAINAEEFMKMKSTTEGREFVKNHDLIYIFHNRIDKLGETIGKAKEAVMVMIDHHLYPDLPTDYEISDTSASSTSELVYDFMEMMGGLNLLDIPIGECLMAGIMTDTGSFTYNISSKLFDVNTHTFALCSCTFLRKVLNFSLLSSSAKV